MFGSCLSVPLAVILFQIFVVESAQRLQHSGRFNLKEIESPVRSDLSGNLFAATVLCLQALVRVESKMTLGPIQTRGGAITIMAEQSSKQLSVAVRECTKSAYSEAQALR